MFKYSEENKNLVNECAERIKKLRKTVSYDFDFGTSGSFFPSQLDCLENLIDDWKQRYEDCYAIIMCDCGRKSDSGVITPSYATICTHPHWSIEGIMTSSSLYDATKFELNDTDLPLLLDYVNKVYEDKNFKITYINKGVFGTKPIELWSDEHVRGDFDKTGKICKTVIRG